MLTRLFVTGIGTDIGKTVTSAILTRALDADYWKPVQAGYETGTDSEWVKSMVPNCVVHSETYKLKMAASPHIAAREEGVSISMPNIVAQMPSKNRNLIIEGPGGLMVPLNEREFVTDLIKVLPVKVILVSRNYLGSINHSLLTAEVCRKQNIPVVGWIFNDQYLSYEQEIAGWSGFPRIASIPYCENINKEFIEQQSRVVRATITSLL